MRRHICVAAMFFGMGLYVSSGFAAGSAKVCFDSGCFQVEVARSQAEKQRGLMARDDLPERKGMLFVYDSDAWPEFWMKNMRIPLDFVWMDAKGQVVDLDENVAACVLGTCHTLSTVAAIRYVLEISAASIHQFGIKVGDQAMIQLGESQ